MATAWVWWEMVSYLSVGTELWFGKMMAARQQEFSLKNGTEEIVQGNLQCL